MDKRPQWLVYGLSMAALIAGLLMLSAWLAKSNSERTIGIQVEAQSKGLVAISVAPRLPASQGGLRGGDLIRSVAGRKVSTEDEYQSIARTFQAERPVAFEVERDGLRRNFAVIPGIPVQWMDYSLNALAASFYLIIGILTLKRRPGYLRANLLSFFCAAVAIELATTAFPPIGLPLLSFLLLQLYYLLNGAQFGFELHLASVFPERQPWLTERPWIIPLFYFIGTGVAILGCLTHLAASWKLKFPWSIEELDSILSSYGFPIWAVLVLSLLGWSALHYPDPDGRREAGILLLGIIPWAFYILYSSFLEAFDKSQPAWISRIETFSLLTYPAAILFVLWREALDQQEAGIGAYAEFRLAKSVTALLDRIAAKLVSTFHSESCFIWSQEDGLKNYKLTRLSNTGKDRVEVLSSGLDEVTRILDRDREIVESETLRLALPMAERNFLEQFQIKLLVPISRADMQLLAVLLLGRKKSGDLYTPENRKIIQSISWHALAASAGIGAERGSQQEPTDPEGKGGKITVFRRPLKSKSPLPLSYNIFISYAHDDPQGIAWLRRLDTHFKPLSTVRLWHDGLIGPWKPWRKEIENALRDAKAAILLIGPDFLASKFIMETELPLIEAAERNRGLVIFPLVISACHYESVLGKHQAVHSPEEPLDTLDLGKQNTILHNLTEAIEKISRDIPVAQPGA